MIKYLFAYGTLRPGCSLYRLIEPATEWYAPVAVRGQLYHVRSGNDDHPVYPVADFGSNFGIIHGDLLCVDGDSLEFEYMDQMETQAGYEAVTVNAIGLEGYSIEAIGYHYPYLRGDLIPGGDWKLVLQRG